MHVITPNSGLITKLRSLKGACANYFPPYPACRIASKKVWCDYKQVVPNSLLAAESRQEKCRAHIAGTCG